MICRMMGANFADIAEVSEDRPGKDAAYLLDSKKARTTLGWADTVALEDGVRETIDWINRDFAEIQQQPLDYIHKA